MLAFVLILTSGIVMGIEEPKYKVIEKSEPFELRAYQAKIIAEVEVSR
jgi:hypothetical protein